MKVSICTALATLSLIHLSVAAGRQTHKCEHEAFALTLFQQASRNTSENFVISPYSVSAAFGMTAFGARGQTFSEMAEALGFSSKDPEALLALLSAREKTLSASTNEQVRLECSNSLWPERRFSLNPGFVSPIAKSLGATVNPITMDSVGQQAINEAVSKATHGRIPVTFTAPPSAATALILINTVYFNGKWMYPFSKDKGVELPFESPKGKVNRPFLSQTRTFPLYEDDDFSLLRLPYKDADFEMALILPKAGKCLADLERSLTAENLYSALKKSSMERVKVQIPKFEFASTIPLVSAMKKMGMKLPFTGEADFSGISEKGGLSISDAFQKANVTVDEEGTVASAVTAISVMRSSFRPNPKLFTFRADRPFLFLIRHFYSREILFIGRVTDPTPPVKR